MIRMKFHWLGVLLVLVLVGGFAHSLIPPSANPIDTSPNHTNLAAQESKSTRSSMGAMSRQVPSKIITVIVVSRGLRHPKSSSGPSSLTGSELNLLLRPHWVWNSNSGEWTFWKPSPLYRERLTLSYLAHRDKVNGSIPSNVQLVSSEK